MSAKEAVDNRVVAHAALGPYFFTPVHRAACLREDIFLQKGDVERRRKKKEEIIKSNVQDKRYVPPPAQTHPSVVFVATVISTGSCYLA